jgi:hypothetical protein
VTRHIKWMPGGPMNALDDESRDYQDSLVLAVAYCQGYKLALEDIQSDLKRARGDLEQLQGELTRTMDETLKTLESLYKLQDERGT